MKCSLCNGTSVVKDCVYDTENNERLRQRQCNDCGKIFYTVEMVIDENQSLSKAWNKNYRKSKNRKNKE